MNKYHRNSDSRKFYNAILRIYKTKVRIPIAKPNAIFINFPLRSNFYFYANIQAEISQFQVRLVNS